MRTMRVTMALSRRLFLRTAFGAAMAVPLAEVTSASAMPFERDDWMYEPRQHVRALAFRPLFVETAPTRTRDLALPAVSAQHVAIVDEGSGVLLYGDRATDRAAIASTTKIATASVVLERWGEDRLDETVPITIDGAAMAARGSTVMGLVPGQTLTMRTMLYGLMLPSGNDAAEQIALAVGEGSRERFIGWMNDRAATLGLKDTHFANPHGLDNAQHFSTTRDLSLLARDAMLRWSTFRDLARAQNYSAEGYRLANLNRLLGRYQGADGVKIGFTRAAGRTMVSSAVRGGRRVYVTIFKSTDLPADAAALLDWTWSTHRW